MSTSVTNVRMLNAIIGSCLNEPNVPNDLWSLGYTQIVVERTISFDDGTGVTPDLAIASRVNQSACCIESKTGQNIEAAQAHKYTQITPELIERYCHFTLDYKTLVVVDASYICPDEVRCVDGIRVDLNREGLKLPLLAVGSGIRLAYGQFNHAGLRSLFATDLAVNPARVPPYYRFDKDAPLDAITPWVLQSLVSFAAQGKVPFTTADIAADAYGTFWTVTGTAQQKEVIQKTGRILAAAMDKELKEFLECPHPPKSVAPGKSKPVRKVRRNTRWTLSYANASGTSYPMQRLQLLQRACEQLIDRLDRERRSMLPGMEPFLYSG